MIQQRTAIMYIHRKWLVETIKKYKDDPSKSPYWFSVVSAYDSAAALAHDMRRLWLAYPQFIERMAPFWSHTQSAAVSVFFYPYSTLSC
jgi:hypothetical protein